MAGWLQARLLVVVALILHPRPMMQLLWRLAMVAGPKDALTLKTSAWKQHLNTFAHISLAKASYLTKPDLGLGKYSPPLGRGPDIHSTAL